jgi:hypothetical protein
MKIERRCLNCHHFAAGVCECAVPASIVGIRWRTKVKPTDGAHCAAHRMRSSRKVAASHQAQVGESA